MRSSADARILPILVRELRRGRFDVLHCHLVRANLWGRVAGRLANIPVIISTLRNIEAYMEGEGVFFGMVRRIERVTQHLVSRYVAVSHAVRRSAIERVGIEAGRIETILNAVEIPPLASIPARGEARSRLRIADSALVVGSIGRLHEQKNFELFIDAAAVLSRMFGSLKFVIIGEGEKRRELELRIHERGLTDCFVLPGFVSNVPLWLAAMDVFVLPSRYEGLPRALMEAMASAKPVVATDAGGNAELVESGRSGFITDSTPEALAASVRALLLDPDLRRGIGRRARERVESRFGAYRMANEYSELYCRLLVAQPRQSKRRVDPVV